MYNVRFYSPDGRKFFNRSDVFEELGGAPKDTGKAPTLRTMAQAEREAALLKKLKAQL